MKNKEQLEKIIDNWQVGIDNFNDDEKRELLLDIEKDLEVLALIKLAPQQLSDIVKSKDYYDYVSMINSTLSFVYTKEQYNKIKEWLRNDNTGKTTT